MTLTTLIISFAIIGAFLTFIVSRFKPHRNSFIAFLQYFTGVWFVFSGFVKAVDPYGTSIKMQQYFADFQTTFEGTPLKSIAGIFPVLSHQSMAFSIFMILFELIIGVCLLLGYQKRATAWAFMIIMLFFTVLTGYTHLTGYVPNDPLNKVNFFEFSKWVAFDAFNRRVTDCGCFGDFLKLDPRISFYKDLFLSAIGLIFIFKYRDFTSLFTARIRGAALLIAAALTLLFSFRNAFWNEPYFDFRPFKVGVNIRDRKKAEETAMAHISITYIYKNKKTGQVVKLAMDEFMKRFKEFSNKEEWDFKQEKGEPEVPQSKISDFSVSDVQGRDATDSIINEKNYLLLALSYDLKSVEHQKIVVRPDTTFTVDTIRTPGVVEPKLLRQAKAIIQRQDTLKSYTFDPALAGQFIHKINPLMEQAEKAGYKTAALIAFAQPHKIDDFRHETNSAYPFYTADELVVKTMIRSNPGLYLIKDGTILGKWHIGHLPDWNTLKMSYLK